MPEDDLYLFFGCVIVIRVHVQMGALTGHAFEIEPFGKEEYRGCKQRDNCDEKQIQ